MGVPTSAVGYTAAMPRREDHEVHKDMWWGHWTEKKTPSFKATISSVTPRMLWNQKSNSCDRKTPPLAPVLSHINPLHSFPAYFFNIHFNIIHPSTPRSGKCTYHVCCRPHVLLPHFILCSALLCISICSEVLSQNT